MHFNTLIKTTLKTIWLLVFFICTSTHSFAALDYNNPPSQIRIEVDKEGTPRTLNLTQYNVAPSLRVKVIDANGSASDHQVTTTVHHYRGECEEEPGSVVSATLLPNGSLRYHVSTGDSSDDWGYTPSEEGDPSQTDVTYTVSNDPAQSPNVEKYIGASFFTPQRGGQTGDGKAYGTNVSFVVPKEYTDGLSNNSTTIDAIVRKAKTSVTQMNVHYIRDVITEVQIDEILIRFDTTPSPSSAREQLTTYWANADPDHIFSIYGGGGSAMICTPGGGTASQGTSGADGDGVWYSVLRHEYGHLLGSHHMAGGAPEGESLMSGNVKARFSGYEAQAIEMCGIAGGTNRYNMSDRFTGHDVPPYARWDDKATANNTGEHTIDVLANDHDANGDNIAIASFDTFSVLGSTIQFVAQGTNERDQLRYSRGDFPSYSETCGTLCESADLWLDASDLNSLTDANGVSGANLQHSAEINTWKNKNSNTYLAEATETWLRPSLQLTGQNLIGGKPSIVFNEDMMEITDLDVAQNNHETITSFMVGKDAIWVQRQNGFSKRNHSVADGLSSIEINASAPDRTWTSMSNLTQSNPNYTATEPGIALGVGLYAYEGYDGAHFANMAISEMLIFRRELTSEERMQVEYYLARKWGLQINDQFEYQIVDSTGRTGTGTVIVPWLHNPVPELSSLNGKQFTIENRWGCAWNDWRCNMNLSFGGLNVSLFSNDPVPWKFQLVENTTDQFYITNKWNCGADYRCNYELGLDSVGTPNTVLRNQPQQTPWQLTPVPGTTSSYYLRNRYKCDEDHLRCNSHMSFLGTNVELYRSDQLEDMVEWKFELVGE